MTYIAIKNKQEICYHVSGFSKCCDISKYWKLNEIGLTLKIPLSIEDQCTQRIFEFSLRRPENGAIEVPPPLKESRSIRNVALKQFLILELKLSNILAIKICIEEGNCDLKEYRPKDFVPFSAPHSSIEVVLWNAKNLSLQFLRDSTVTVEDMVQNIGKSYDENCGEHVSIHGNTADIACRGVLLEEFVKSNMGMKRPPLLYLPSYKREISGGVVNQDDKIELDREKKMIRYMEDIIKKIQSDEELDIKCKLVSLSPYWDMYDLIINFVEDWGKLAGKVQFQDPRRAPIIEQEEEEAEEDMQQETKSKEQLQLIRNNNDCAPGEDDVINNENTTNENSDEVDRFTCGISRDKEDKLDPNRT
ncbi:unnamed protein product [Lepeophtheirus salmonis]|uniref:(salmon louse) hypothetical protein n=1 Tax=Lepeophtheirus salmonis TaxID=72036 RepID=A0A7R8CVS4_LEPSM|nr:unnamed protein product [Lepeophtheirus salmonis]CAF2913751.1 unnamed protein product [Lepeophtheirus salmonis]